MKWGLLIALLLKFGCLYSQACPTFPKPVKEPRIKLDKPKRKTYGSHFLFMGFGYYTTLGQVDQFRKDEQLSLAGRAFMPSLTYYHPQGFMITFSPGYDYGFQEPVIYGSFSYRIFPLD